MGKNRVGIRTYSAVRRDEAGKAYSNLLEGGGLLFSEFRVLFSEVLYFIKGRHFIARKIKEYHEEKKEFREEIAIR